MTPDSKAAWRQELRARRKRYATDHADSLHKIQLDMAFIAVPQVSPFRTIGGYAAVGSEINPALITGALQKNATIALPRVTGPGQALTFHATSASQPLLPDYGDIPAPPASATLVVPHILLVPLLGVDRRGVRLGQGQGHYDATIAALRARGRIFVLGVAYECQLVDELPCHAHDQKLDALVTPARFLRFALQPAVGSR